MVLYHANGRVVQAHEDYLEQQAQSIAEKCHYVDQIEVYKQRNAVKSTDEVQIIIDDQKYMTLYCEIAGDSEILEKFRQTNEYKIPTTVNRRILVACSTFAQDYFTHNPEKNDLHLPVCYPEGHERGSYSRNSESENSDQEDDKVGRQMAFIRPEEIENYVIPWLKRMQEKFGKAEASHSEPPRGSTTPLKRTRLAQSLVSWSDQSVVMGIPELLVDKIHLYNAMLQLGLPKFVQLPLIDVLVLQMYRTKLEACELDALEHTIGRFYSRGVAVLDPVLNHFIGTYSFRSLGDRTKPEPSGHSARLADDTDAAGKELAKGTTEENSTGSEAIDAINEEQANSTITKADNNGSNLGPEEWKKKRRYLQYCDFDAKRKDYTHDTYILPPELPVLGHSIKHWSGVRQNQSIAAAHTGFSLNIGKYKKFIRRNSKDVIDEKDWVEEETNRLIGQTEYQENGPGKEKR
ncbi:hypothetical protein IG631_07531 [Alternaria alternata]|nr:hypothetical protein IG631_07531 [Alternaria alternata]